MWNITNRRNLQTIALVPALPLGALEFFRTRLKFTLDEMQAAVVVAGVEGGGGDIILNCCRQWGKTTVVAGMLVYKAWTLPETTYLVCGPATRQAAELIRKARAFVDRLGIKARGDGIHEHAIQFPNGSRIIAIPCKQSSARGYSAVNVLVMDEAAQIPDEAYNVLRPSLATTDGQTWLLSTPFGMRGFHWKEWSSGDPLFTRFTATAEETPRIGKKFLDRELRRMGRKWMDQEYGCKFGEPVGVLFGEALLDGAIVRDGKVLEV